MEKADITLEVVACLVAQQFPEWSALELRPVDLDGWDNTTCRLGDDLAVRLPSHERYVAQIDKEHRWLPVLAPYLPLPIPRPVARGAPGCGFPRPWSVYRWLPGEPATPANVQDADLLAADLAAFLRALHAAPTDGGPPPGAHSFERAGPVWVWDEQVRTAIDELADTIDAAGALAVWDSALAVRWDRPGVSVHGDITGSNLLVRAGRLAAVIDFGCAAVGDPACDLTPVWTMFEGTSRERFVSVLDYDDGTWARARGWALWKALVIAAGRPPAQAHQVAARFGWRRDALAVIDDVIADLRRS